MKTCLLYGLGITLAGALLVFVEFFLGYHSDPEKFQTGQVFGTIGGLLITIVGLVYGMREVRERTADRALSYGRGVGIGALITIFSGIFGAVFYLIYGLVINPEFHELVYQAQIQAMEAKGLKASQIESMEGLMRFFTGPVWFAFANLFGAPLLGTLLSLIIALFLKRAPAANVPPPV
ncbi:MAG: hypothetical protein A3G75_14485 [Verrucomicrobia bacterium RIFCSPLOWO2_12_FULL_64_8]|nr:MAG: hypothetical protein A3G75_14485 [Verrucomicrobia bacterium RIFCSPLOWO2_12_FULL_64_8]